MSAQVLTQSESDPWAKAGVMLRGNTGPGAAFYDVVVTPANGISVQYRSPQGVARGDSGVAERHRAGLPAGDTRAARRSAPTRRQMG